MIFTVRIHGRAVLAILVWLSVVSAQQLSIANLIACGVYCLYSYMMLISDECTLALMSASTIPEANCSLLDISRQCKSDVLPGLTSACLLEHCTMHDQLSGFWCSYSTQFLTVLRTVSELSLRRSRPALASFSIRIVPPR